MRLDFGDERRVAELHRLWQSLEMEIVRVLEATNRLHESAEWELAGLVEKQPGMLDGVVAKQTGAIEDRKTGERGEAIAKRDRRADGRGCRSAVEFGRKDRLVRDAIALSHRGGYGRDCGEGAFIFLGGR